jgi:hypothetical protein
MSQLSDIDVKLAGMNVNGADMNGSELAVDG